MEVRTEKDVWNKAIQLLSRREYSRHELEKKLYSFAKDVDSTNMLSRLAEAGYLSDERFAESFIRMKIGQGHGLNRIRFELSQKGIDAELITQTLESLQVDWFELAAELYQRKYRSQPRYEDFKEKNKRMRYMSQKGFSIDEINYALEQTTNIDDSCHK